MMNPNVQLIALSGWHSPASVMADWMGPWCQSQGLSLSNLQWPESDTLVQGAEMFASQISGPVIIAGWSLGGLKALAVAEALLKKQRPVFGIITLATNIHFQGDQPWQMPASEFKSFQKRFQRFPGKTTQAFQRLQCQTASSDIDTKSLTWLQQQTANEAFEVASMAKELDWLGKENLSELYLKNALIQKVPGLHVLGAEDQLVPASCLQQWQQIFPEHRAETLPGHHLFPQQCADAFQTLLQEVCTPWVQQELVRVSS